MSNTRNSSADAAHPHGEKKSNGQKVARKAVEIGTTALLVTGATLPIDFALQRAQTLTRGAAKPTAVKAGTTTNSKVLRGLSLTAAASLGRAFAQRVQGAAVKNVSVSHRTDATEFVSGTKLAHDSAVEHEGGTPSTHKRKSHQPSLGETIVATTGLGVIDTALTQPSRNKGIWYMQQAAMQARGESYEVPKPTTMTQRMKASKFAFPISLTGNVINIGGLVFTPWLRERFGISNHTAVFTTGIFSGLTYNALRNVQVNQVIGFNGKTYQGPTARQVAKQLYSEGGAKAFGRGGAISTGYSIAILYIVPEAETIAKKVGAKAERAAIASYHAAQSMFAAKAKTPAPIEEVADVNRELVARFGS